MTARRRLAVVLLTGTGLWAGGGASCAPHPSPAPAPAPEGVRRGAAAPPATPAHNPPRYVPGHLAYEITSVGTVSSAGDTTSRPDTIITLTSLAYDARWTGPRLLLSGQVRSHVTAVSAGPRGSGGTRSTNRVGTTRAGATASSADSVTSTRRVVDSSSARFEATIDSATGAVRFGAGDTIRAARCGTGPTIGQARELATDRPRSFAPGAAWRDTLSDTTCLGGVPLVTQAVRDYTVESQTATDPVSGDAAILVSHRSRATMRGDGRRSGQVITLNGSGDGTTQQYFDRSTGLLLSAHTVAALNLDVGVNGRVQHLRQQADWQAKLVKGR